MRRIVGFAVVWMVGVQTASGQTDGQAGWTERVNSWLCSRLGYGCSIRRTMRNRGSSSERPHGGALRTAALDSDRTTTVWDNCDCWSPVPAGGSTLWVATGEGIWLVDAAKRGDRRLLLRTTDVVELIGPGQTPDRLLFIRSVPDASCALQLWTVGRDGRASAVAADPDAPGCGDELDFRVLAKPGQVSAEGTLTTLKLSDSYQVSLVPTGGSGRTLAAQGAARSRFDGVWLGEHTIAFVEGR